MTDDELRTELQRLNDGYKRHAPPYGDQVMRAAFALDWFLVRFLLMKREAQGS